MVRARPTHGPGDRLRHILLAHLQGILSLSRRALLPDATQLDAEPRVAYRTLTWTDWGKHRAHPRSFGESEVNVEFLKWLKRSDKEYCEHYGVDKTRPCFLFARKFSSNALDKLLRFASTVMHF